MRRRWNRWSRGCFEERIIEIIMDVDTLFPHLSTFVQPKTKGFLNQRGLEGEPRNGEYWNLGSSCWAVLNNQVKWSFGPHEELKTLDEFIHRLPEKTPIRRIRDKICSKGSEFLDTVVEATWALHFLTNGNNVSLEEPLDTSKLAGKNADLVVTLGGVKHWLDATSIQLSEKDFPVATVADPCAQLRSSKDVSPKAFADVFADKARDKYRKKFNGAVRSGLFQNEIIGILLCVVKSEQVVRPDVLLGLTP